MNQKRAETIERMHVECPFCGFMCDKFTALRWCSRCFVEWYKNRNGAYIFDKKRKTPRFAVAKAVMKSGGTRLKEK